MTVKTPQGPKHIGTFGDAVLRKRVAKSKHFLWKLRAWGMDATALRVLSERGCATVEYLETESKTVYTSTMTDWQDKGQRADFGHGPQVFLPLMYWTSRQLDQAQLELFKGA